MNYWLEALWISGGVCPTERAKTWKSNADMEIVGLLEGEGGRSEMQYKYLSSFFCEILKGGFLA